MPVDHALGLTGHWIGLTMLAASVITHPVLNRHLY